jgi:hypothetical protein
VWPIAVALSHPEWGKSESIYCSQSVITVLISSKAVLYFLKSVESRLYTVTLLPFAQIQKMSANVS